MTFQFSIPGEPQGKGRPRVVRNNGFTRTYTPEKTAVYENLIKVEFQRQNGRMLKDGPVKVWINADFRIPKSVSKRKREAMVAGHIRPTRKPDADNIAKVVCDALNGLAWHDDSQVVMLHVEKRFAEEPEVYVTITEVQ